MEYLHAWESSLISYSKVVITIVFVVHLFILYTMSDTMCLCYGRLAANTCACYNDCKNLCALTTMHTCSYNFATTHVMSLATTCACYNDYNKLMCVDDYYAQLLLLDFSYNTNVDNYCAQYFFLIFRLK